MPFDLFSSHMTICNCVGVNDRSSPRCSTVRRRLFLCLFPSFRRIGIFILRRVRCTVFSPVGTYVEMKISQCERNKTPTVSIHFLDPANLLTFEHFQCGCHHLRMIRCLLHFLTLNCLVFRIVVAGPAKMTGLVWLSISDVGSIEVHLGKIHSPNRFETNRISQSV